MPIDISDYTPAIKDFIRARQLACVYVLTTAGGKPARIGQAADVAAHFASVQSQHPYAIELHCAIWTPGKMLAIAIASAAAHELEKKKLRGQWFEVDAAVAVDHVSAIVKRSYHGVNIVPHERIIGQLSAVKTPAVKSAI